MADTLKLDQYDDDLTIGLDDYNEDLFVDEDDLLRFQPPESPLAKLQSIVVSIDWEISDDILLQFNEEILALREVWSDEKIYLVYLQALEQISKYMYQEKVDVHPSAVKLLPLFFQNLEKISSPEFTDEEEIQAILVADVKRFNFLKKEISSLKNAKDETPSGDDTTALQSLKALVLGLDWEVTEEELGKLRREVMFLENLYSGSKPRLILLQGIGTLAVYIQHKSGNADAGAFRLLHDFFATLERLATSSLSAVEEKEALFVEVEKFNFFKAKIAGTLSPEAIEQDERERAKDSDQPPVSNVIVPAFSDVDPKQSVGFQEDTLAEELGDSGELADKISTFFPDEQEQSLHAEDEETLGDVSTEAQSRLDDFFGDEMSEHEQASDRELALQGVAVEIDDDDESVEDEPLLSDEDSPAFITESKDVVEQFPLGVEDETESRLDDFFGAMEATETEDVDKSSALQGVNVETDADDESEEAALGRVGDEPAPALASNNTNKDMLFEEDIESRLDSFFSDDEAAQDPREISSPSSASDVGPGVEHPVGEDVAGEFESVFGDDAFIAEEESEGIINSPNTFDAVEPVADDEPVPALSSSNTNKDMLFEEDIESRLDSFFSDDEAAQDPREMSSPSDASDVGPGAEHSVAGETTVEEDIADEFESVFGDDAFITEEESEGLIDSPNTSDAVETASAKDDGLLDEDDIEATLDSFFEDFGDDTAQQFVDEEGGVEAESIAPALSFVDDSVAPGLAESRATETEEDNLLAAGLEDTLDAFFTSKDDVDFTDTPEEEIFVDEFFEVEDDAKEMSDGSAVLESVASMGSAVLLASSDSDEESKDLVDETGVEGFVDSFFDNDVEKDDEVASATPVADNNEVLFEEVSEDTPEDYVADVSATSHEGVEGDDTPLYVPSEEESGLDSVASSNHLEDTFLFADIRGSISSLSFDLSEAVVEGVLSDINALRQKFSGDPIAKSFLQLMSTLSQHILRYQYEACSEAFTLLMDTHETLENTIAAELSVRQNSLLAETYKVLQWQQEIIDTQGTVIAQSVEEKAPVQDSDVDELFSEGEDELIYAGHEEECISKDHDVDLLRGELQELRQTLQDELASLRRDLTQG